MFSRPPAGLLPPGVPPGLPPPPPGLMMGQPGLMGLPGLPPLPLPWPFPPAAAAAAGMAPHGPTPWGAVPGAHASMTPPPLPAAGMPSHMPPFSNCAAAQQQQQQQEGGVTEAAGGAPRASMLPPKREAQTVVASRRDPVVVVRQGGQGAGLPAGLQHSESSTYRHVVQVSCCCAVALDGYGNISDCHYTCLWPR
jgi:hypothetical protein